MAWQGIILGQITAISLQIENDQLDGLIQNHNLVSLTVRKSIDIRQIIRLFFETGTCANKKVSIVSEPQTANKLFGRVRDSFDDTLSEVERARFASWCNSQPPAELMNHIRSLPLHSGHDSKWSKALTKIHDFTNDLKPYFEIIGIVVSAHPEWAAIGWGALRLILDVGNG